MLFNNAVAPKCSALFIAIDKINTIFEIVLSKSNIPNTRDQTKYTISFN